MKTKFILFFALVFAASTFAHSTKECNSDETEKYLRVAFSSLKFLDYHENLIKKGFSWEAISSCNEYWNKNPSSHTAQLRLLYCKGGRKKGNEFKELEVEVNWNSKSGKNKVISVSLDQEEKEFLGDVEKGPVELDLTK